MIARLLQVLMKEEPGKSLDKLLQQQAYMIAWPHTGLQQASSESLGPALNLAIGPATLVGYDVGAIREFRNKRVQNCIEGTWLPCRVSVPSACWRSVMLAIGVDGLEGMGYSFLAAAASIDCDLSNFITNKY